MSLSGKIRYVNKCIREFFVGGGSEHCWKKMRAEIEPDAGFFWRLTHYADMLLASLYCPGLDTMDYLLYHFPEIGRKERKLFITEGGLREMVVHFNGIPQSGPWKVLEDKTEFNRTFSDLLGRGWITGDADDESFAGFCRDKKLIVKPVDGGQGKGIFTASPVSDEECLELKRSLGDGRYIIEELLRQHSRMAELNPSSVNTVRIYTVLDKDGVTVHLTGAVLRIGRAGNAVDNWHSGGIAAEVDTGTGTVISDAVDGKGNLYSAHPDSRIVLKGFRIPEWDKAVETVIKAHKRTKGLRYVGWDIAFCEDGGIAVLEGNPFGGVHLQQQPGRKGKKEEYAKLW